MNKLLFAVCAAAQLTATFVTPEGETKTKVFAPLPLEATALQGLVALDSASGFQVFTANADPTNGGKRVEVLGSGGVIDAITPEDDSEIAVARDLLLAVLDEAIQGEA